MANSLFKAYAKQAKKRLKEGFWSDVKNQRNYFELVAATNGGSADFAVNRQKQALKNQLYNREHSAEEEFYRRVCGHSVGRRGGNKSDCAAHGQRSGGADESAAEKYIYAATVRQVSTGCGALRKRKEAGIFYIRKQTQRR